MIISIIEQALIALPLIVGAYLTISLLKLPDFSIESAYLFGAVMAFVAKDLPLPFILFGSLVGGMLVGAVVSFLNQFLNLPFLLGAIITNGLFHGLTQYVLGTSVISFHPNFAFPELALLVGVGVTLVILIGLGLHSELGYSLSIYGNNPHFFSNHGISGKYILTVGVLFGHGCAGISGFLFAQSNGFVDLTMSFGIILLCLTALLLGKIVIRSKRPTILIPLVGILGYFFMQQSLLRLGLNLRYFNAFQALFVLTALSISHRKKQHTIDHLGV